MKRMMMTGGMIAVAITPLIAYAVNNCCGMTGTIVACDGTANYFVVCDLVHTAICTASSPGSPYPDAEYASPSGTDHIELKPGACSARAVVTGTCCGGAVTSFMVYGAYWYGSCDGNPCPAPAG